MFVTGYDPEISMREARGLYFELNDFGPDGGYDDAWVTFKLGVVRLSIPNTKGRVRAVRYHDLHHVITGYETDTIGEFEIAAWEIGAGCKDYLGAWVINLSGMAGGFLTTPRRTLRAFMRGRHSASLYGLPLDALLEQTVSEVRSRVGLDRADRARITPRDAALFVASIGVGLVCGSLLFAVGAAASPFVLGLNLTQRVKAAAPQRVQPLAAP